MDRGTDQAADAIALAQRDIRHEMQLRHVPDVQAIRQQMAQSAVGAVQRLHALGQRLIVLEHAHRNARVAHIR